MSTPYIGEIRIWAAHYPPAGWAFCDGSLINIGDNEALFNVIGTTYGGDGETTFALPDLRGRIPIGMGQTTFGQSTLGTNYAIGTTGGTETVQLTVQQIPAHAHAVMTSSAVGDTSDPSGAVPAASPLTQYSPGYSLDYMHAQALSDAGTGQPHTNMMPFLVCNYIISLFGVYPN